MTIQTDSKTGIITLVDDIDRARIRVLKNGEDVAQAAAEFFTNTALPVPISVTPLQMRKALRHSGLKPLVDGFLATIDEEALEEWEYATAIDRKNPTIAMAAGLISLKDEQVDDLFRLASEM